MMKKLGLLTISVLIFSAVPFYIVQQHKGSLTLTNQTTVSAASKKTFKTPKIKSGTKAAKLLIVINKKHPVSSDYNPNNGATTGNNPDGSGLTAEANNAKNQLIDAMQAKGFPIADNISGFRYYGYQKTLYDNYVSQSGQVWADKYSARPGYSEHQSGLAFDLVGSNGTLPTSTKMYNWLQKNAYKYGLIVRYPKGKAKVTGYEQEQWHMRYIGIKYAKQMHKYGIKTLEEFTGISGGNYNHSTTDDVPAIEEYQN